jgi:hypothetical protein
MFAPESHAAIAAFLLTRQQLDQLAVDKIFRY